MTQDPTKAPGAQWKLLAAVEGNCQMILGTNPVLPRSLHQYPLLSLSELRMPRVFA